MAGGCETRRREETEGRRGDTELFVLSAGVGPHRWLTIWRGWQRLVLLAEGYALNVEK
jgi:hypothetical protein